MGRVWIPVCVVLSITLAGFLLPDDPVPGAAAAGTDQPTGAGWTRVLENDDAADRPLFGFELALDPDDWEPSGSRYRTELAVAPFGGLEGWALFLFDEDLELHRQYFDMPYEYLTYPTGEVERFDGAIDTYVMWLYADEPVDYTVVMALVGAGGVAITPDPHWTEPPTAEELLERPSAEPVLLGTGSGMALDIFLDITAYGALGAQLTYGAPTVTYGGPLPSDVPSPVLDLNVQMEGLSGWGATFGVYLGAAAQGTWTATIEADTTHEFEGLVMEHAHAILVESVVFGLPVYLGIGDTSSPLVADFHVDVTNGDGYEIYYTYQASLDATLGDLIGADPQGFHTESLPGLVGNPVPPQGLAAPQYTVEGDSLVTRLGDLETVLIGPVPPQVQDAFDAMDA